MNKEKKIIEINKDEELQTMNEIEFKVQELINKCVSNNREIARKYAEKIVPIIEDGLSNDDDFTITTSFIALADVINGLAVGLYDEEELEEVHERAVFLIKERILPSLIPEHLGGKLDDKENFTMEDMSIRNMMILVSVAIDMVFYNAELQKYSDYKKTIESLKEAEKEAINKEKTVEE